MRMLICAIRVAGISLIAGGLLLLQRRYPGVQPGRYLRLFLCRNYTQFLVLIWRKMRKIPGFPCRFLSFLRFKVLTPAAGSDILLLQTIAWFPRNWTSGSQRGLPGGLRKQQLICAIRVAGWPARAGDLFLLQRRYPGVQPGRYLRSFYALYAGIIFIFLVSFWQEMAKNARIPLPISFISPFQGYFYVKSSHSLLTKGPLPC